MKPKHITRKEASEVLDNIDEELNYFKPIEDVDSFCNPSSFVNNYVLRQVNQIWPDKSKAEVSAIKFAQKIGVPVPKIYYYDVFQLEPIGVSTTYKSKIFKDFSKSTGAIFGYNNVSDSTLDSSTNISYTTSISDIVKGNSNSSNYNLSSNKINLNTTPTNNSFYNKSVNVTLPQDVYSGIQSEKMANQEYRF